MKAGRELDALVAEKVMGLDVWYEDDDEAHESPLTGLPYNPEVREYSVDIASAWEVVEKMLRSWWIGVDVRQSFMGTSVAFLPHPCSHPEPKDAVATVDPRDVTEDCEPEDPRIVALAICLAALKAVGVEVPDEA